MPELKKPKYEQFVRFYIEGQRFGWSQGTAYIKAGFRSTGHGAEVNASKLLKRDDIQTRIAELAAPAVKRTRTTLESLIGQFDEVFDGAMGDKQFGAAGSAAAVKAKLTGFLRDKLEIGAPWRLFTPSDARRVV